MTLIKQVVNDNGGTAEETDWTLSADGPTPISGSTGDPAITNAPVQVGTYDLSESGPPGYDAHRLGRAPAAAPRTARA